MYQTMHIVLNGAHFPCHPRPISHAPFLHPPPLHGQSVDTLLPYEASAGLLKPSTGNSSDFIHGCFTVRH